MVLTAPGALRIRTIYHLINRTRLPQRSIYHLCRGNFTTRFYSSGDGDDKKSGKSPKDKLNALLNSIIKDGGSVSDSNIDSAKTLDLKLAVPSRDKERSKQLPRKKVGKKQKPKETYAADDDIRPELKTAVKAVTDLATDDNEKSAIENELVKKLRTHESSKEKLSDIFSGMPVEKTTPEQEQDLKPMSRAEQVRRSLGYRDMKQQHSASSRSRRSPGRRGHDDEAAYGTSVSQSLVPYEPIDLFGAQPLGIFSKREDKTACLTKKTQALKTWDRIHAKELELSIRRPPANGFEEMILWTEQGKLWKYPIDNEQGLENERNTSFTEHVFLEPKIASWCPKKGPVRHFMELVCVGLSKNPYLTVKEKEENLEWYHQYFAGKSKILKELGAGNIK